MNNEYSFLYNENLAKDLKTITPKEAKALAAEMRSFLVETTKETGGHLASSLGVVELSIALHRSSIRQTTASSGTSATNPTSTSF